MEKEDQSLEFLSWYQGLSCWASECFGMAGVLRQNSIGLCQILVVLYFMAGATMCTSSVNAYIVDTYGQYSASAIAAILILRCIAGFAFLLFAPYM